LEKQIGASTVDFTRRFCHFFRNTLSSNRQIRSFELSAGESASSLYMGLR
jgi:hypothetical protein